MFTPSHDSAAGWSTTCMRDSTFEKKLDPSQAVKVSVYHLDGRHVFSGVVNSSYPATLQRYQNVHSGMYIARVTQGTYACTHRVVVL
jgi:hypothetical protein